MTPPTSLRPVSRRLLALALPLVALAGCALDYGASKEEERVDDPYVRQRVLARMAELAKPAAAEYGQVKAKAQDDECDGVCELAASICGKSKRICDLAAEYPDDEEVQDGCRWPRSDCEESRGACTNCGGPPPR